MFWRVFSICALLVLLIGRTAGGADDPGKILDDLEAGYTASRQGDYASAIESFTKVLNVRQLTMKERATAYLLRGEAYKDSGDAQRAINDFSRAIRLQPIYPQALYYRGICYERLGQWQEAYQDIRQALKFKPQKEVYQRRLGVLEAQMKEKGIVPEERKAPTRETASPKQDKQSKPDDDSIEESFEIPTPATPPSSGKAGGGQ